MVVVAEANGLVWQLSQFFFLYLGTHADTLFVRISLIIAQTLLLIWLNTGTVSWSDSFDHSNIRIHWDTLLWGLPIIVVAVVPLIAQLTYNDSRVRFPGQFEFEAEAMWRDWFRRSGITRADFKLLLAAGQWVEIAPGGEIPMEQRGCPELAAQQEDTNRTALTSEDVLRTFGDLYYYILGGHVKCEGTYMDGQRLNFEVGTGSFLDSFSLAALLGQAHAGLALQSGPLRARVDEQSTYFQSPPPEKAETKEDLQRPHGKLPTSTCRQGVLLLRWRREDLVRLLKAPCNAATALRVCADQDMIDELYERSVAPSVRDKVAAVREMRKRQRVSQLPKDAACQKRPFLQQWWLSHISLRDLWRPSPFQRAMNAVAAGSQEWSRLEAPNKETMACVLGVATV